MAEPDDPRDPDPPGTAPDDARSDEPGPPEEELVADELDRARARALRRAVLRKSLRHERAQRRHERSAWSFLGTFGLIGWTIAVPTLMGLALGLFLDDATDTERSFTVTFLVVGAAVGCVAAWYWIDQERRPDD